MRSHGTGRPASIFGALFAQPIDNNGHLLGLAHINYLLARGEAVCEIDVDGVRRYRMK